MSVLYVGNASLPPDVSPDFVPSERDARIADLIVPHCKTPRAVALFDGLQDGLSDYGYWFLLGTLWVDHSGWTDLSVWRRLFASGRPNRATSLMKPSELRAFERDLPEEFSLFRAHRPGETGWIAGTVSATVAARFAQERGVDRVGLYKVRRSDVIALFLRRQEQEVIVIDPDAPRLVKWVPVKVSRGLPAGAVVVI